MARVIVDYVPLIKDNETDIKKGINTSLQKVNEILRLMSTGINTIEFGDGTTEENIYCDYVSVEFGQAGVELTGTHSLNRVPTAIVGIKLDRPGAIYFSKAATTSSIYLKSDTDSLSGVIIVA